MSNSSWLARLFPDQRCCSHVWGISLLSIPPYPAAQPNTWGGAGPLLSLSSRYYVIYNMYLLALDFFWWIKEQLEDVFLLGKYIMKQTSGIRLQPGQEGGFSSSVPRKSESQLPSAHIYYSCRFSGLEIKSTSSSGQFQILQLWMFVYLQQIFSDIKHWKYPPKITLWPFNRNILIMQSGLHVLQRWFALEHQVTVYSEFTTVSPRWPSSLSF